MPWLAAILTVLAAYFLGAIPFGFLVARMRGVNIFEHGSGNIGATNVGRILGWPFGVLVFVLDFAKGAAPVALALVLKRHFDDDLWTPGYVEVAAGMAAFLGHLFPVYLRFHGGKGVAAGCGAVSVLLPIPTLAGLFVWFVLLCATRYMSLASIAAVLALCAGHLWQPASWDWREPRTWFCLVAGALVVGKHRANIKRLFQGTENQTRDTNVMRQLSKSLHVLALGMWFGMTVFFTFVVALSLLDSFRTLGKAEKRETWFPQSPMYAEIDADLNGPEEQGTRAFGHAVGPIFPWYFAIQGACGFIALATAFPLVKLGAPVHRWRLNLLLAAVALVMVSWPIERKVEALRGPRNKATEAYLASRFELAQPQNKARQAQLKRDHEANATEMNDARADFTRWHLYSLFLNFATILCVTAAMALAGNLGDRSTKDTKGHEEEKKDEASAVNTSEGLAEAIQEMPPRRSASDGAG